MKMKKVLFVALLTASVSVVSAQTNKGQILAGGTAGFTSQKDGDFKSMDMDFSPNVGYFFMNNLAGGLRLGIGTNNTTVGDIETKSSSMMVAPFVRYYILPSNQKLNIFADATYGFGQNRYKDEVTDAKSSMNAYAISAGPAIFLSPNTALEFTLNYSSTKFEGQTDRSNSFGLGIGFQVHLGSAKK